MGNLGQDKLRGQIGHPEFHFDDSAFSAGQAYLEKQRQVILRALADPAGLPHAWAAFGRLTHAAQDFYAHSNYLALWLKNYPEDLWPAPDAVQPMAPEILGDPHLRSGKVYALEILSYIRPLAPLVRKWLPRDAHVWMNLDHPGRGPLFPYALAAAQKRTLIELEAITGLLTPAAKARFLDS